MILRLAAILCLFLALDTQSQYYYKDIVTPQQTVQRMKKYRMQKVHSVKVMSYESSGEPTQDFEGNQQINNNFTNITTRLKTPLSGESLLTTYFNAAGQLIKTVDTADGAGSVSNYAYDDAGRIKSITNVSTSAGGHQEKEVHNWNYDAQGKPQNMLRIKNETDTTTVNFVLDEKGNIAEENSSRKGRQLPSFYYYYDDKNRLTDVVAYNVRAQRLLPIYIFEYNAAGEISTMMVVPEGSDNYQKWYYQYDQRGLKIKETCFNKRKQVLGRVEYEYR
jgi:YD repeat-containing protein